MDKEGLIEDGPDVHALSLADIVADEAPDVQDADDIVNGSLIDREPAVVLFLDKGQHILAGHIDVDRRHIHPAGQDALDRDVAELQGRGDQVLLLLIDGAVLRHILNDVVDVIFSDRGLLISFGEPGGRIADPGQQGRGRPQDHHEKAQKPRRRQAEGIIIFPRKTFGQHLSEEKHYQGGDQCGNRNCGNSPPSADIDSDN